jgi:hypothetical protein
MVVGEPPSSPAAGVAADGVVMGHDIDRRPRRPRVPVRVLDGGDIVFTAGADTGKGWALARERRPSLVVDDEQPPVGGRHMGEGRPRSSVPATACPASCWCGSTQPTSSPGSTSLSEHLCGAFSMR